MPIGKWKKIKTEESYQCGRWYRVDKDRVITPGGKEGEYYVIRRNPTVAIIPIDKDGNTYLTLQHRYAVNSLSLELPMGYANGRGKKELMSSAKREMEEEVQLASGKWKEIGCFNVGSGISNIVAHLFLAKDVCSKENPRTDALDKNVHETVKCSYAELRKMIAVGAIKDSLTLSAFVIADSKGIFDEFKK